MTFAQYLVLDCFQKVDQITVGDLQSITNLPLSSIKEAVLQLAKATIVDISSSELNNASVVTLNPTPTLEEKMNLVPPVSLTVHTRTVAAPQDMSAMHKTKIDAAIVRVMKKEKFVQFADLAGKLSSILDFVPDVGDS